MDRLGEWILPAAATGILLWGMLRRVPVFDTFLQGAKEGLSSSVSILPALIGLMMGVTMLEASGALDMLSAFLRPAAQWLGFPVEAIPLALLRPFSGSGSTALAASLFENISPDSFEGRVISVLLGSSETTFYAVAVYFGAIGVKKSGWTIPAALTGDFVTMAASVAAVILLFGV